MAARGSISVEYEEEEDTDGPEALADLALELHNDFRRDHDAPPMDLDTDLCKQAESYANRVANGEKPAASDCAGLGKNIYKIQHSEDDPYYHVSTAGEAMREAVNAWYGYSKDYNWSDPVSSMATAKMFSQLVWKSTGKLGTAVAMRGNAGVDLLIVVVALYSPQGNVVANKAFADNVHPRIDRVP